MRIVKTKPGDLISEIIVTGNVRLFRRPVTAREHHGLHTGQMSSMFEFDYKKKKKNDKNFDALHFSSNPENFRIMSRKCPKSYEMAKKMKLP